MTKIRPRLPLPARTLLAAFAAAALAGPTLPTAALAVTPTTAPAVAAAGGFTQRDYRAGLRDVYRRALVDGFRAAGPRHAATDDRAAEFLRRTADALAFAEGDVWSAPPTTSADDRAKVGAALLGEGGTHPLVRYAHAAALADLGRRADAMRVLEPAIEAMAADPASYPALARADAAARLIRLGDASGGKARSAGGMVEIARPKDSAALDRAGDFFADNERAQQYGALHDHVYDGLDLADAATLVGAWRASRDVDPWVAALLAGRVETKRAWAARGGGWADDVTERGWAGFNARLAAAYDHLRAAHDLHPDRPQAANALIPVAMGGAAPDGETDRTWFDRATAAQLDYKGAWQNYEYALRPRWGGSIPAMVQLGIEAAETGRYDTGVPYRLVVALRNVSSELGTWRFMAEVPALYPAVAAVFEGYDAEFAAHPFDAAAASRGEFAGYRQTVRDQFASEHLVFASMAERWAEAAAVLARLDGGADASAIKPFGMHPPDVIAEVQLRNSPAADDYAAARAAHLADGRTYEQTVEALKGYEAALNRLAPGDPATRAGAILLMDRIVILRHGLLFERGGWVDLRLTPALGGWRVLAGDWSSDRTSIVGRGDAQGLAIAYLGPVSDDWELSGTVEVLPPSPRPDGSPAPAAGWLDAPPGAVGVSAFWRGYDANLGFLIDPVKGRLSTIRDGNYGSGTVRAESLGAGPHAFTLRVAGDRAELTVGDGPSVAVDRLSDRLPADVGPAIVLGGISGPTATEARFSGLRVRRVPTGE